MSVALPHATWRVRHACVADLHGDKTLEATEDDGCDVRDRRDDVDDAVDVAFVEKPEFPDSCFP